MVTPANVYDKYPLPHLLHGREKRVYGDSAYRAQKNVIRGKAPQAKDFTNERVRRRKDEPADKSKRAKSRDKSKIRARVEQCLRWLSDFWGFTEVRYRGLAKNACRAFTALALANIYLARDRLMPQARPQWAIAHGKRPPTCRQGG